MELHRAPGFKRYKIALKWIWVLNPLQFNPKRLLSGIVIGVATGAAIGMTGGAAVGIASGISRCFYGCSYGRYYGCC